MASLLLYFRNLTDQFVEIDENIDVNEQVDIVSITPLLPPFSKTEEICELQHVNNITGCIKMNIKKQGICIKVKFDVYIQKENGKNKIDILFYKDNMLDKDGTDKINGTDGNEYYCRSAIGKSANCKGVITLLSVINEINHLDELKKIGIAGESLDVIKFNQRGRIYGINIQNSENETILNSVIKNVDENLNNDIKTEIIKILQYYKEQLKYTKIPKIGVLIYIDENGNLNIGSMQLPPSITIETEEKETIKKRIKYHADAYVQIRQDDLKNTESTIVSYPDVSNVKYYIELIFRKT
jgi:hypothetical protein